MATLLAENNVTALDEAQQTLSSLEERVQEITSRQAAIPAEIEAANERLGAAVIGRLAAGAIHSQVEKLEREARQLAGEAAALAPHLKRAEAALALRQAVQARERYMELAAEAALYPRLIFDHLEAAYRAIRALDGLQSDMADAAEQAGRLAPITLRAEQDLFIPLFVANSVAKARQDVLNANVGLAASLED